MVEKRLEVVKLGLGSRFEEKMLKELNIQFLWHYTSSDSFIKIVNGKQLRYTDCLFLNDIEEFNYIFQVLDEYIKQNRKNADFIKFLSDAMDKDNYDFVPANIKLKNGYRFTSGRYYILSGSSNPDSLPLWTYYSKTGKYDGYSLKIDVTKVFHDFRKYGQGAIYAGRVEYDLQNQIEIIESVIDLLISENNSQIKKLDRNTLGEEDYSIEIDMLRDNLQSDALDFLNTCRLFFKNSKFSFESELRIAVLVSLEEINGNKCDAAFSSVNGIIKPSIGLSLEPEFPIAAINVGPMIDLELAKIGIRRLFEGSNIRMDKEFAIEKSDVNIRY